MKISIVSTLYFSEKYVKEFYDRMMGVLRRLNFDYEIIFVDDGSLDNSLGEVLEIQKNDSKVKVVELSRNFGHHKAIMAGISKAKFEYVFLIDCDLEEQPEWLELFINKMKETNWDVVFAKQKKRIQSPFSNILGILFWKIVNFNLSFNIPTNQMTCRLMKKNYIDALLKGSEKVLYLGAVFSWVGFKQGHILLSKQKSLKKTKSTYSFSKKVVQFLDALTSFSVFPLYLIFFLGLMLCLLSASFTIFYLLRKLIYAGTVLSGFTSLIVSIWFIGGIILLSLSIIGIYIGRIFEEAKSRPQYIIRKFYGGKD